MPIRFSTSLEVLPGTGPKNSMLLLMPSRKAEKDRLTEIQIVLCLKPFLLVRGAFLGRSIWNKAHGHHFTLSCGHSFRVAAFVLDSFIFHWGILKKLSASLKFLSFKFLQNFGFYFLNF